MTPDRTTRRNRLRLATGVILGVGLTSALAIYLFAPADDGLPAGYDVTQTKHYRHDLELYGGKANVQMDEFRRWFQGLWRGKALAGTVACLSVLAVLGMRFLAGIAEAGRDGEGVNVVPSPSPDQADQ